MDQFDRAAVLTVVHTEFFDNLDWNPGLFCVGLGQEGSARARFP